LGISVILLGLQTGRADDNVTTPSWAQPVAMATKQVSPIGDYNGSSQVLPNLDCTLLTYRLAGTSEMKTGCFTNTAYGLFDNDNGVAMFTGSSDALPVLPYGAREVLAAWPNALNMLVLNAHFTGGSQLSLYRAPFINATETRNFSLKVIGKQLGHAPDIQLRDHLGGPLIANPQALTFSDGGSWLVTETLSGAFIRMNLTDLEAKPFAPAFVTSPGVLRSQVAVAPSGRFVAIGNNLADSLKIYDLTNCGPPPGIGKPESCPAYDYRPYLRQQITGLQTIRHIRFLNEGLLSLEVVSSVEGKSGMYVLAPSDSITSLIDYLGLGDSYTSGEGAFQYLAGTDTADNTCHLSSKSYPLLLAKDIFTSKGGRSVACSGARSHDIGNISENYRGQVRGALDFRSLKQQSSLYTGIISGFLPGYVAQQHFAGQYQPGVMTVSSGGNDIGFGSIIRSCVAPHLGGSLRNTCYESREDRQELLDLINRTLPSWTRLYRQLQAATPATRLYVVGYPEITDPGGNCADNVHLNQSELTFAQDLIGYLNGAIRQAASKAGVTYVDISQALHGHRLCETASHNVAVNGLTAGNDGGALGKKFIGRESYHPNALGHELIEQAILRQTANLTAKIITSNTPVLTTQALLNVPSTGRTITTRLPAPADHIVVSVPGQFRLAIDQALGLKPLSSYTVILDSRTTPAIAQVQTDSSGAINQIVTLPPDTSLGYHEITVSGQNQAGEPAYTTQLIYISPPEPASSEPDQNNIVVASFTDTDPPPMGPQVSGQIQSTQPPPRTLGANALLPTGRPPITPQLPTTKDASIPSQRIRPGKLHFKLLVPLLCLLYLLLVLLGYWLGRLVIHDKWSLNTKTSTKTPGFRLQ
jgi:hypothetical protein